MPGNPAAGSPTRQTSESLDDDLKRSLERNTAVQGEREEDVAPTPRTPAGADSAPPTARPTRGRRDASK